MTKLYEKLQQAPQTGIIRSDLNPQERSELRTISVSLGPNRTTTLGQFSTIYYLEGDEERAVELFVNKHRDQLEQLDFSQRNPVKSSVDQELYDLILDELGERSIEGFDTVVREDRLDGTTWLIERAWFDNAGTQRYAIDSGNTARLTNVSPQELYDSFEDQITETDLEDDVEGNPRLVLEYFRVADAFQCTPVTNDNALAIIELDSRARGGQTQATQPQNQDSQSQSTEDSDGTLPEQSVQRNEKGLKTAADEGPDTGDSHTPNRDAESLSYLAGAFDTAGTISMKIKKNDRFSVGYEITPQILFSRPTERASVLSRFEEYCEDHDVTYRIEDKADRDSHRLYVSGQANTRNFLEPIAPRLVQQAEGVSLMLETILPGLEEGKHTSKEGFLKLIDAVDRLRELRNPSPRTKYTKNYFEDEWDDVDVSS